MVGNIIADAAGLPATSDHRQVLYGFMIIIFWGAVGVVAVLAFMA